MKTIVKGLHLWAVSLSNSDGWSLWVVTRRNNVQDAAAKAERAVKAFRKQRGMPRAFVSGTQHHGTIDA